MSFNTDAKQEIMRAMPPDTQSARFELTGALLLCGSVAYRGRGRYQVSLSSENAAVTRHFFTLTRALTGLRPQIQTVRSSQLGDHTRYRLELDEGESSALLSALDLLDDKALLGVRRALAEADFPDGASRLHYLRGAFLAVGWVSEPDKAYHLEFAAPDSDSAALIGSLVAHLNVKCGLSERKSQVVAYVKDFDGVSQLLARLGAPAAYMAYENARILRQLRGEVNRQTNCDENNTNKTVLAAQGQLEDIALLKEKGLYETLPETLKAIAEARLNHPAANLIELGQAMDPPLGKSGVNNRLRRLSALAEEARQS